MTGNLGRRLYASFWETANPLFVRSLRVNRVPSLADVADSKRLVNDVFVKGYTRRISSSSTGKTKQITRRFASGGFLILGASPSSAVETGTTCAMVPENIICHASHHHFDRLLFHNLTRSAWRRGLHTTNDGQSRVETPKDLRKPDDDIVSSRNFTQTESHDTQDFKIKNSIPDQSISDFPNRHLIDRLPHIPQLHRPTKEELLAAATGFWSRLKIRFKWFSIRSVRPFNLDEIAALFSWVLLGHLVWVVLGTTTFFSLVILAINTVFAQGKINNPRSSVTIADTPQKL